MLTLIHVFAPSINISTSQQYLWKIFAVERNNESKTDLFPKQPFTILTTQELQLIWGDVHLNFYSKR